MCKAIEVARKGLKSGEVHVGCVIVKAKEIVAQSHNLTVHSKNNTTHCEINCIRDLAKKGVPDLQGLTLYVTVEPCIMCAYALHVSKVSRVVFGCDNDKFGGNGGILSLN